MQEPRQMYGIGCLLKKAARGIKKVVKSPLGKAAIIGGLGMIPFGASGATGWGRLGGMLKGFGGKQMAGKTLGGWANRIFNPWQSGKFSGKHAFGL